MTRNVSGLMAIWALGVALSACAAEPPPRTVAPPNRIPDIVETPVAPAGEPVTTASMPRDACAVPWSPMRRRRFKVPENAVVLTRRTAHLE